MLSGKTVGFALTGSHCTIPEVIPEISRLVAEGVQVIPILSTSAATVDTRFGKASDLIKNLRDITGREPITTIVDAEPIGPQKLLDVLVIAPCTGNTLAKIACGITDTAVTMAYKAHLRNGRPVVIGISTNDALSGNARNIGLLLNTRNVYFVPFVQDSPEGKPRSCIADMKLIYDAVVAALEGRQLQPIILGRPS